MDQQQIAELLCSLKSMASTLPKARCNPDGSVSFPSEPDGFGVCEQYSIEQLAALSAATSLAEIAAGGGVAIPDPAGASDPQTEAGGFQLLCKQGNSTGYYLTYFVYDEDTSSTIAQWIDETGAEGTGIPGDAVRCPDAQAVETCYADRSDASNPIFYTQVVSLIGGQISAVNWVDGSGAILATAPANVERCESLPWQPIDICINGDSQAVAHVTDSGSVLGLFSFNGANYQPYSGAITSIELGTCPCADDSFLGVIDDLSALD